MYKIKSLIFGAFFLVISGCASVQPIKNQVSDVSGKPITYIFNGESEASPLKFGDYRRTRHGDGWLENWGIKTTSSGDEILVTKFADNGVAGSVNEYSVKVTRKGKDVTLTPYKNRIHQDGLVLPKPVPSFNENSLSVFLSSTRHEFGFEVDSNYPSESVNANFKRTLSQKSLSAFKSGSEKIFENTYFLKVDGAESKIEVKTYPYRNGSKCTVNVIYYTQLTENTQIELGKIESLIKEKVTEIVNS